MTKNNRTLYDTFCVARQPIFDRDLNTYGYELLYRRDKDETYADFDDPCCATMCVATSGFIKSQESVNQSKRLFINFTERLIIDEAPRALPPSVAVIEVLEDVIPSQELIEKIVALKQDGYLIAIDDYEGTGDKEPLLNLADIIKVDVLNKNEEQVKSIFEPIANLNVLKLAEKVDSKEQYEFLNNMGFDFFQGYFFALPENMSGRKLSSSELSKFRILSKLNETVLEIDELVSIVNSDIPITYRLLKLMNSAAFGFSMKIESVRHAIVLLGSKRLIYWLRMVVMSDFNESDKPNELFVLALNRAKTLEEIAHEKNFTSEEAETLFLLGMLSLLDVMLDSSFTDILDVLPLSEKFQNAYIHNSGQFADYLNLLRNLEINKSREIQRLAENNLNISTQLVYDAHIRALNWTDAIFTELI